MRIPIRLAVLSMVVAAACGGGASADANKTAEVVAGSPEAMADPATLTPESITPQEVALGDSIFHGLIPPTSCQACHGPDAKGTSVAPNLTDSTWLHSDGSFPAIYKQIATGVPQPKVALGVMPPFGGSPLSPERHRAVAAYVFSLSHKVGK
jgi:mono/diheme cytochrome c family protein